MTISTNELIAKLQTTFRNSGIFSIEINRKTKKNVEFQIHMCVTQVFPTATQERDFLEAYIYVYLEEYQKSRKAKKEIDFLSKTLCKMQKEVNGEDND